MLLFFRELEELEAIKEAEEAALAEAEAAAVEAAQAMEGILGVGDPGGGDGGGDTPDDSESGTGPLVELGGNDVNDGDLGAGSPSRTSLTGPGVTSAGSVDGVNQDVESDVGVRSLGGAYRSNESIGMMPSGGSGVINTTVVTGGGMLNRGLSGSVTGMGQKLGSLPPSPFVRRASKSTSFSSHVRLTGSGAGNANDPLGAGGSGKKPLVLFTYMQAMEHLPYADDSTAVTPKSELNGGIVVDTPTRMAFARKLSYNSHTGKLVDNSYNSHTDLRYPPGQGGGMCSASSSTKEGILTRRMVSLFNEQRLQEAAEASAAANNNSHNNNQMSPPSSIVLDPITGEHMSSGVLTGGPNGLYDAPAGRGILPAPLNGGRDSIGGNFINTNGKDSVDIQVSAEMKSHNCATFEFFKGETSHNTACF